MQCFIKGVKELVESQNDFYKYEPCLRGQVVKKKERAIKLICKTIQGQDFKRVLKEDPLSQQTCRRKKRKRKFGPRAQKKDFDVISALSKLGNGRL